MLLSCSPSHVLGRVLNLSGEKAQAAVDKIESDFYPDGSVLKVGAVLVQDKNCFFFSCKLKNAQINYPIMENWFQACWHFHNKSHICDMVIWTNYNNLINETTTHVNNCVLRQWLDFDHHAKFQHIEGGANARAGALSRANSIQLFTAQAPCSIP